MGTMNVASRKRKSGSTRTAARSCSLRPLRFSDRRSAAAATAPDAVIAAGGAIALASGRTRQSYFATQALKRWFSLSRFSSQNLSLRNSEPLKFAGAVGRFASVLASIIAVAALVVTP